MKLTTTLLLDLCELSDAALRLYVTAQARLDETSADGMTAAQLMNLPGVPRNPKALARAIQELAERGLVVGEGGAYLFAARKSELSRKRAEAGRLGGLAKASKLVANSMAPPLATGQQVPAGLPGDCQASTQDPPLSLISGSGSDSAVSQHSLALSSGSEPESKPARVRRWRRIPADWEPNEGHRQLARELGVDIKTQLVLIRDHEFKDPKSDADATFRRWLRQAAEYRPARQQVVPGSNFNRLKALAERAELEEKSNAAQ